MCLEAGARFVWLEISMHLRFNGVDADKLLQMGKHLSPRRSHGPVVNVAYDVLKTGIECDLTVRRLSKELLTDGPPQTQRPEVEI